jgi:SAM-dependent methyltransferase
VSAVRVAHAINVSLCRVLVRHLSRFAAMSPKVKRRFHNIIRRSGIKPERALEVGGLMGEDSLLRFPELAGAERYCLNLVDLPSDGEVTAVKGNANDMRQFKDGRFDLVVCCSTLEHDKRFWLSVAEMKRVLAPGGLLVIGVPGYVKDPERDQGRSTLTYRVHYSFDYYRFSEQAVREVFFEGMERVRVRALWTPPRVIGHGWKPPDRITVRRRAARTARAVRARVAARA